MYCASIQVFAEPIVLVGPVVDTHTVIPVENERPSLPKSMEKGLLASIGMTTTGTCPSAGRVAVLWIWRNCAVVEYPDRPRNRPADALTTSDAARAVVEALVAGIASVATSIAVSSPVAATDAVLIRASVVCRPLRIAIAEALDAAVAGHMPDSLTVALLLRVHHMAVKGELPRDLARLVLG